MTSAGTTFSILQRDIVLIPFPYSDLSGIKKRPSLIVSNSAFNNRNDDIICCVITSSPFEAQDIIKITNGDLENGFLDYESKIKPYRIFTISKEKIIKIIGRLNSEKYKKVVDFINNLVRAN